MYPWFKIKCEGIFETIASKNIGEITGYWRMPNDFRQPCFSPPFTLNNRTWNVSCEKKKSSLNCLSIFLYLLKAEPTHSICQATAEFCLAEKDIRKTLSINATGCFSTDNLSQEERERTRICHNWGQSLGEVDPSKKELLIQFRIKILNGSIFLSY